MELIKHENTALLKKYFIPAVLKYDGFSLLVIDVPNHIVHSIAINKEGVIYIGGKNEIGYLTPNSKGRLRYTWNITSGLQDGSVYYVFEDCQENLWLCLSKGILRIKDASLTFHPS